MLYPIPPEDSDIDAPRGSLRQALRDLALSVLVVSAIALIVSFLAATSAHAGIA